jgi:hypothetical protein
MIVLPVPPNREPPPHSNDLTVIHDASQHRPPPDEPAATPTPRTSTTTLHNTPSKAAQGPLVDVTYTSAVTSHNGAKQARQAACGQPTAAYPWHDKSGLIPAGGGVPQFAKGAHLCSVDRVALTPATPAALLCRVCGCRRCACCRPDPRRPASAPGSRSRGRAATLVDADLAAGPDETRSSRSRRVAGRLRRARSFRCDSLGNPDPADRDFSIRSLQQRLMESSRLSLLVHLERLERPHPDASCWANAQVRCRPPAAGSRRSLGRHSDRPGDGDARRKADAPSAGDRFQRGTKRRGYPPRCLSTLPARRVCTNVYGVVMKRLG